MRNSSFVRVRTGLTCSLVIAMSIAPAVAAWGGGLFQRRARSYGSRGASSYNAGTWGSHGATGGGRVTYTHAQHNTSRPGTTVYRGTGHYASHGAAGGAARVPASHQSQSVQAYYPNNRVVTRRPAAPTAATSASQPLIAHQAAGMATASLRSQTSVPPPPVASILKRAAFDNAELLVAGTSTGPAIDALQLLDTSLVRTETLPPRRYAVMKPILPEVNLQTEPVRVDETNAETVPVSDESLVPRNVESSETKVEKQESSKSVTTDQTVPLFPTLLAENSDVSTPEVDPQNSGELVSSDAAVQAVSGDLQSVLADAEEEPRLPEPTPSTDALDTTTDKAVVANLEGIDPFVPVESDQRVEGSTVTTTSSVDQFAADENEGQADSNLETDATGEPSKDSSLGLNSILVRSNSATEAQKQQPARAVSNRARLVLHVPATANVFLMEQRMATRGTTREFNVPLSDASRLHSYQIRVEVPGQSVVRSTQKLRAGQRIELTFDGETGRLAIRQ